MRAIGQSDAPDEAQTNSCVVCGVNVDPYACRITTYGPKCVACCGAESKAPKSGITNAGEIKISIGGNGAGGNAQTKAAAQEDGRLCNEVISGVASPESRPVAAAIADVPTPRTARCLYSHLDGDGKAMALVSKAEFDELARELAAAKADFLRQGVLTMHNKHEAERQYERAEQAESALAAAIGDAELLSIEKGMLKEELAAAQQERKCYETAVATSYSDALDAQMARAEQAESALASLRTQAEARRKDAP